MARATKTHPEDYDLARIINNAVQFTAYLRVGPFEKYVERGFATYEDARTAADRLERDHATNCRKALVYAISKANVSVPVSDHLLAVAAELRAAA